MDDVVAENLCIKIREQINIGNIVVDVCSRSPDQKEKIETFFRKWDEALH